MFSKTMQKAINLKKLAHFFQVAIHFRSWPPAAQDTYIYLKGTSGIILNKTGPLFWVSTNIRINCTTLRYNKVEIKSIQESTIVKNDIKKR